MSDNEMIYCLIAFILGWLISRMMGNGFRVGAADSLENRIKKLEDKVRSHTHCSLGTLNETGNVANGNCPKCENNCDTKWMPPKAQILDATTCKPIN